MRILIWSVNFSIGGGMRLLHNLTKALSRQPGVEHIRLVVGSQSLARNTQELNMLRNVDVIIHDTVIDHPSASYLLANIDVVYYYWPHTHQYTPIDRPTLCTFHDSTFFDFVPPFSDGSQLELHWNLSKRWLDHVTTVAVSSQHVKNRLIAHFGPRNAAAYVIPHAITPIASNFSAQLSPAYAAALPKEYIIYPSNTSPHKNHSNLLLALAKYKHRKKHPLVLTGYLTEKLRQPFPNFRSEHSWIPTLSSIMNTNMLQIDSDVYPLGFVSDQDIPALIKNAKALIMPSLSEGGGSYPVEEALRLGTPVLCSDIPVMREHLARHSTKIAWFDPHSPDSIVRALEDMNANYASYKQSAMLGIHDPTETWDDIARKYVAVMRDTYYRYYARHIY
ncbi:glycosyltransferase family 1 protein [Paenibacillus sp. NEAU-GSW1]|uniref:glycosyltransferase family 4 protein n=1 Tax=Paenibacillus sp. NEAU-GSW1 TaxID=2682486 RepID=UPI0012E2A2DE|nr:glycosyltransferase family 1 protein [Paenibacillus sp. NEAU-GSW1]MUT68736.1 glycosyltransferase [Paenibacillus sp. NEAU-GSW1]